MANNNSTTCVTLIAADRPANAHVCYGSLADIATRPRAVRSCHEGGHRPKDFELNRIMSDVARIVERANGTSNV
jgi:hypothetical protein